MGRSIKVKMTFKQNGIQFKDQIAEVQIETLEDQVKLLRHAIHADEQLCLSILDGVLKQDLDIINKPENFFIVLDSFYENSAYVSKELGSKLQDIFLNNFSVNRSPGSALVKFSELNGIEYNMFTLERLIFLINAGGHINLNDHYTMLDMFIKMKDRHSVLLLNIVSDYLSEEVCSVDMESILPYVVTAIQNIKFYDKACAWALNLFVYSLASKDRLEARVSRINYVNKGLYHMSIGYSENWEEEIVKQREEYTRRQKQMEESRAREEMLRRQQEEKEESIRRRQQAEEFRARAEMLRRQQEEKEEHERRQKQIIEDYFAARNKTYGKSGDARHSCTSRNSSIVDIVVDSTFVEPWEMEEHIAPLGFRIVKRGK